MFLISILLQNALHVEEIVKNVFSEAKRFTNNYGCEELDILRDIELLN